MYLGYREAAEFLGMKLGSLYALVHQQRIPHIRLGSRLVRFDRDELVRWMREHAVQPGEVRLGG